MGIFLPSGRINENDSYRSVNTWPGATVGGVGYHSGFDGPVTLQPFDGSLWERISIVFPARNRGQVITPDGTTLFLLGGDQGTGNSPRNSVDRSLDGGLTWTETLANTGTNQPTQYAPVNNFPAWTFAGDTYLTIGASNISIFAPSGPASLWKSLNANLTSWVSLGGIDTGIFGDGINPTVKVQVVGSNCVYMVKSPAGDPSRIYIKAAGTFTPATGDANSSPFTGGASGQRRLHGLALHNTNSVVMIGGQFVGGGGRRNDVWRSDDGGNTFTQLLADGHSQFPQIRQFELRSLNGKLFLMGGDSTANSFENSVWRSDDDGANWVLATSTAWGTYDPINFVNGGRTSFQSVVFNDNIYIMGGIALTGTNVLRDVWRMRR